MLAVDSFTLMVSFFMLAGKLMEVGECQRIVRLADCLVGWMAGGLAHVIVVTSAFSAHCPALPQRPQQLSVHIDSRDEEARISCG